MIIIGGVSMLISEVTEEVGLTQRTLRYYDEIGLVSPVKDQSGYRSYSYYEVEQLKLIKLLLELGKSLSESRIILREDDLSFNQLVQLRVTFLEERRNLINVEITKILGRKKYGD